MVINISDKKLLFICYKSSMLIMDMCDHEAKMI